MSNEEQVADTIEMLYERLNSYNKQDLFNYGYLLESNEILRKGIEEKDKEIERLNNIIEELEKWLKKQEQHFLIDDCQKEVVYEFRRISTEYTKILDKLKELKGE